MTGPRASGLAPMVGVKIAAWLADNQEQWSSAATRPFAGPDAKTGGRT